MGTWIVQCSSPHYAGWEVRVHEKGFDDGLNMSLQGVDKSDFAMVFLTWSEVASLIEGLLWASPGDVED